MVLKELCPCKLTRDYLKYSRMLEACGIGIGLQKLRALLRHGQFIHVVYSVLSGFSGAKGEAGASTKGFVAVGVFCGLCRWLH